MFEASVHNIDRFLPIFEHSEIETRHFCAPLDWFQHPRSVEEKHALFVQSAVDLAERAVRSCLGRAGTEPGDIDHIFMVTTTGTVTPSLDAYLFNRLSFRPHIKRTPIWGLGCAGGAAGLSRAAEYVKAFPKQKALLVSVELCSLTFIRNDTSKSNIVATSLFADGAAAALVAGDECDGIGTGGRPAPRIVSTQSTIWPESLDVMGWDVTNEGLKVIFSKDIPSIIARYMHPNVEELSNSVGWPPESIEYFILHPGGAKVLTAYEEALRLPKERLDASRRILRDYGNMSSCTVLFVLEDILRGGTEPGSRGLAGALGPGFSSELLLLQF